MRTAFICFLIIACSGCKKFDHKDLIPNSCELCVYADSLEGSYYGKAYGMKIFQQSGSTLTSDSLRITVEHVYLDHGTYIDSTIMFLKITSVYQSEPGEEIRMIEMRSKTAFSYFSNTDYDTWFILSPQKIVIHDEVVDHYSQMNILGLHYEGFRE